MLFHRHHDILADCKVREQGAILEHHAPAPLDAPALFIAKRLELFTKDFNRPRRRMLQADNRPQKDRFSGAGRPDHAQHFAALDVEIEVLVHGMRAETRLQIADADDRLGAHMPSSM